MRARAFRLMALVAAALGATPGFAEVRVSFSEPNRFTDAGRGARQAGEVQREIGLILQRLGQRHLSPGQRLEVEILDVDLAGNDRVLPGHDEVRVLRGGADWPRIRLRYVFESAPGKTDAGEERLDDKSYLQHGWRGRSSEALPHEKRLLETWFKERIVERKPAPR